ncbi:hypothetical protein [Pseudomonas luteola]|uniref:hypothetical protein n=1 Tax=Pseudomonas luteola TaxID=47886 RepID=UPI0015E281FF|nr:hypothetical protein [Pseudomonas zeshuii]MBA1246173.1 hypothetical protein [Pseudomonas zeshuii]
MRLRLMVSVGWVEPVIPIAFWTPMGIAPLNPSYEKTVPCRTKTTCFASSFPITEAHHE